ncbi:MAG: DNA-directed RNA polymerase subunit omega [Chlamydiae bacterium]|nr:DNA-directed RNA polymerase subunit omega [Chlamydiota bacterium]MBI3276443.1 DNA-directed RNA polymerase subunit omega [Chlamydiota bacterium]
MAKRQENGPLLINMLTKRIRQLFRGDKPMVESAPSEDYDSIAVREFLEGKLYMKELILEK